MTSLKDLGLYCGSFERTLKAQFAKRKRIGIRENQAIGARVRKERPIVIVGAGPVGLSAALTLTQEGIPVRVLESNSNVSTSSRASTFHAATLEYLDNLGVADELLELGIRAPIYQLRERKGGVIAEYDLAELADETRFPFRLQCEQYKFCQICRRHLEANRLTQLEFNQKVNNIEVHGDRVRLFLDSGDRVETEYLIAADGAHSTIARRLALSSQSYTYPQRFLIVSLEVDVSTYIDGIAHVSYVADPEDWVAVIHSPDHWRLLFGVDPAEDDNRVLDSGRLQERIAAFLEPTCDNPDDNYAIADVTLYRVHRKVLDSFVHGPVVLVGDAAHLSNPIGGQGMNSGIHDAVTLGRRMARVWRGEASYDEILQWSSLRQQVAAEYVLADTDANYRALSARDEADRLAHRLALREAFNDPILRRNALRRSSMLATARIGLPPG